MTRFGLARKHLEEEVFIHFIRRSFKTMSEIRLGYRQSASLLTFKLQVCIAPIQTEKILVFFTCQKVVIYGAQKLTLVLD